MTTSTSSCGFALLMVILLLALLTGTVMQSLVSTRLLLRAGDARQGRLALHAALLDSAWNALRQGMRAGTSSSEYQVFTDHRPSGIHTRIALQGMAREALPAPLQRPDLPVFGQVFSLTAKTESGSQHREAHAIACRLPTGDVRILAWAEHP